MTDRKRKRRRLSDEERAELDAAYEETTRLLEARLAYHRAKLVEERAAAEARAERRRRLKRLVGLGFLGAD
jgi:hypothetical protein